MNNNSNNTRGNPVTRSSLRACCQVLDQASWAHSLTMCDDLNTRFNKTWGLTGKHTDTPGSV